MQIVRSFFFIMAYELINFNIALIFLFISLQPENKTIKT